MFDPMELQHELRGSRRDVCVAGRSGLRSRRGGSGASPPARPHSFAGDARITRDPSCPRASRPRVQRVPRAGRALPSPPREARCSGQPGGEAPGRRAGIRAFSDDGNYWDHHTLSRGPPTGHTLGGMGKPTLEKRLEWECAVDPVVMRDVVFPNPPFVSGISKVTISRDEEMTLRLVAKGRLKDNAEIARLRAQWDHSKSGKSIGPSEFIIDCRGSTVSLRATIVPVPDISLDARGLPPKLSQRGHVGMLQRRLASKLVPGADDSYPNLVPLGPEAWCSDWFINGPHSHLFLRSTKRRRSTTFVRERAVASVRASDVPGGNDARDHFLVESGGIRFTVSKVPQDFAPAWCNPVSIDFPTPVPDAATREAIAEIVSFVIGRRLMPVGSTLFDGDGWPIEKEAVSPWGHGIPATCERSDSPPVPLNPLSNDIEVILSDLVPKYLAARSAFGLKDALLTYWLANETFSGLDLAWYGSAVEALKNRWNKSTPSSSRGEHMPELEYKELLGNLLASVRTRLSEKPGSEAIARKLAGAWRMTGNEQLIAFFGEIKLPVGDIERLAIRRRNAPVHGGIKDSDDPLELLPHGDAYRTLFERVFLKLLGYTGTYVDRTSQGYPARGIDEPCGGADVSGGTG